MNPLKYMIICVKISYFRFYNFVLRILGYTRVYDIETNADLTFLYYALKIFNKYCAFGIDITYRKIGVCKYQDNKYTRFVCYNKHILEIENEKLSSKNYHTIKKIELIGPMKSINVTDAKNNFYDIESHTDLCDMIKFYKIYSGKKINTSEKILITREYFDEDLLELITTQEEINVNLNLN